MPVNPTSGSSPIIPPDDQGAPAGSAGSAYQLSQVKQSMQKLLAEMEQNPNSPSIGSLMSAAANAIQTALKNNPNLDPEIKADLKDIYNNLTPGQQSNLQQAWQQAMMNMARAKPGQ